MYIFPGLGLGAVLANAKQVTDKMIQAASAALADSLTPAEKDNGDLYPHIDRIRDVSAQVTAYVIRAAVHDGQAQDALAIGTFLDFSLIKNPVHRLNAEKEWVLKHMWSPTNEACGIVVDVDVARDTVKQLRLDTRSQDVEHEQAKRKKKPVVVYKDDHSDQWSIGRMLVALAAVSVVANAFAR
jgi:hypothetical protein